MDFYTYNYLNQRLSIFYRLGIILLIIIIVFLCFIVYKWIKGVVTLEEKQLGMLLGILIVLFGLYQFNEYSIRNNEQKISRRSADVIKTISEKLNVSEDNVYINTREITEHTVYLINDKFYQIHWVNNKILIEEMKVPYVDEIILHKN